MKIETDVPSRHYQLNVEKAAALYPIWKAVRPSGKNMSHDLGCRCRCSLIRDSLQSGGSGRTPPPKILHNASTIFSDRRESFRLT